MRKYSYALIEQTLIKVYSRGDRMIESVAQEVNVLINAQELGEKEILG